MIDIESFARAHSQSVSCSHCIFDLSAIEFHSCKPVQAGIVHPLKWIVFGRASDKNPEEITP
jgi:hypothetical protein